MPLTLSNIIPKPKDAVTTGLNMLFPGVGTAASIALKKKSNTTPSLNPPVAQAAPSPTTTPTTQVKQSTSPSGSTLNLQRQLNQQNAGKPGWTPLVEDGIMGPKTQAATTWQPTQSTPLIQTPTYTPPETKKQQEGQNQNNPQSTFAGILLDLIKKASQGSEGVTQARTDLTKFQTGMADKIAAIKSDDIPLEFQQGRAQVVQQAGAEKEAALQTGVQNALAEQQQQLAALQAAGGLAQPVQVPYSNQFIDPQTGLPIGGGSAGGTLGGQVSLIAQKVQSGTMGYDDAVKALSGYGQAGVNQLNQILGPNFNIQQSNAQAEAQAASTLQTGTVGGTLTKQADTVKEHMKTLKSAYDSMTMQFGIPAANAVGNWLRKQTGSANYQSYNLALQNVRDELAKILGGGTATEGSRSTAVALLPDNMTPDQLNAAIKTATELMNSKIEEYTKVPQFGGSQPAGSGKYSW